MKSAATCSIQALINRLIRVSLLTLVCTVTWDLPAALCAEDEPLDLGGVREEHVMIPMRDGVKLSAYVYIPQGDGPWPVLFEQRYASLRGEYSRRLYARLASQGYVVCGANFRGAQQSEGTFVGYRALGWGELKDGFDSVEWLATQPWSNGKIGTYGASQAGYAQNFLAITQPPHLVCQYMIDTGLSLYHEGYRIGGSHRPERFKAMDANCREAAHNRKLMEEWVAHPTYDEYWMQEDCTRFFPLMDVPCFTVGSWYDFMCVGSVQSFIGRQRQGGPRSRGAQQMIIGPWLHGGAKVSNVVSQLTYPSNAGFDMERHMIRWFDHFLKGVDNGVERDPIVRYYVMGALDEIGAPGNEWRTSGDWPIANMQVAYYLQSEGSLATSPPQTDPADAGAFTEFLADPLHPNSIPGVPFPGAADASGFEKQAEVRTFTTPPLTDPVEWTGNVVAEMYLSSSAPDTDLIVRVSDVYPDGRSILIIDMIRRARYREGFEQEVFMEPGSVVPITMNVGWLSQIFNRGHRIRVTIASTGAPFYEPSPNTADPLTNDPPTNVIVAKNRIHHHKDKASRVIAPVIETRH